MSSPRAWYDLLDPELFAITARDGADESGMIATWVMSATLSHDAARIVVALSPENHTAELIRATGRFVVHLLAEDQHELVPKLGLRSGKEDHRKLDGITMTPSPAGVAILAGTCGWSECEVLERVEITERLVLVARVTREEVDASKKPLTLSKAFERLPGDVVEACKRQFQDDARRDREKISARGP